MRTASGPPLRIYASIRTAHLERFATMEPAVVLYHRTRYDFDETAGNPQWQPRRVSRLGALGELARHRYRVVETNEPIMTDRWPDLLAQTILLRLRSLLGRRTPVVAYCIGLSDPADELRRRWPLPRWILRLWSRLVMTLLVLGMDRLAFGTRGCYDLYAAYVPDRLLAARARVFEALPRACECPGTSVDAARRARTVLFVGAFAERKGIDLTMRAWDVLVSRDPDLRFQVIGKGPAQDRVQSWAAGRDDLSVEIDPDRSRIHEAMRESAVLVLLSQRVGAWREQVGLPIVEALSHGCTVVTTDETGLATWLTEHGHVVVPRLSGPAEVADAVSRALASGRPPAEVLADLPGSDSRVAADEWLLGSRTP